MALFEPPFQVGDYVVTVDDESKLGKQYHCLHGVVTAVTEWSKTNRMSEWHIKVQLDEQPPLHTAVHATGEVVFLHTALLRDQARYDQYDQVRSRSIQEAPEHYGFY